MTTAQYQDNEVRVAHPDQEVRLPNVNPARLNGRVDALDGRRLHGWIWDEARPDEAITREQAVIAYTMGSAYAQFAEDDKGSLEPGKLADLAVLSQDIFSVPPEALPATTSRLTLVGGKVAWRDPEF